MSTINPVEFDKALTLMNEKPYQSKQIVLKLMAYHPEVFNSIIETHFSGVVNLPLNITSVIPQHVPETKMICGKPTTSINGYPIYSSKELDHIANMFRQGHDLDHITKSCNNIFHAGKDVRTTAAIYTKKNRFIVQHYNLDTKQISIPAPVVTKKERHVNIHYSQEETDFVVSLFDAGFKTANIVTRCNSVFHNKRTVQSIIAKLNNLGKKRK